MRAGFDAAAAGRPTIVMLVGEAGIGKTRLADAAAAMARAAGSRVVRGEADASVRDPMELWRGVYRSLDVVPVSDPTLPAEERRWEHLEALTGALTAAAPAVVVLEDLHWADAMAVWVLEHLPRALGRGAHRVRGDEPRPRAWHAAARRAPTALPTRAARRARRRGGAPARRGSRASGRPTPSSSTPGRAATPCSCGSSCVPLTATA